jgi:hypothetical protein
VRRKCSWYSAIDRRRQRQRSVFRRSTKSKNVEPVRFNLDESNVGSTKGQLQFDELCKVTGDREEMGFIYIEQYKRSRGARGYS